MLLSQPELPKMDPVARSHEEKMIDQTAPPPAREEPDVPRQGRSWDVNPPIVTPGYDGPKDEMKHHAYNERKSNEIGSFRNIPDTRATS